LLPKRAGDIRVSVGSEIFALEGLGIRAMTRIREGLAYTLGWMTEQGLGVARESGAVYMAEDPASGPNGLRRSGRPAAAVKNR